MIQSFQTRYRSWFSSPSAVYVPAMPAQTPPTEEVRGCGWGEAIFCKAGAVKSSLLLLALFASVAVHAQQIEKRTFVYAVRDTDTLRLDRYTVPSTDSRQRPCLLFAFGGGFVSGTRDDARYLPFFEYYAQRGYAVVSVDYRLGLKKAMVQGSLDAQTFPQAFISTLAMAATDFYDATNYLLAHAAEWGIAPAGIVACGSSAGAITVLMCEYGLANGHPLARELPEGFDYAGVISFAGAIFDMREQLRWARKPAPIMLFHGDADRNVPYDVLRYDRAAFFGSKQIAESLTACKAPRWFYSAANVDHALATRPMYENRFEIDAFLEKLVRQRLPLTIDTFVTSADAPEVPKNFTIGDYLQANFGQ